MRKSRAERANRKKKCDDEVVHRGTAGTSSLAHRKRHCEREKERERRRGSHYDRADAIRVSDSHLAS